MPASSTKRYTSEQKDWMTDKLKSKRYQSVSGQIRTDKILNSYTKKFGEYRPIDGFGMILRKLKVAAGLGRARTRPYKKRATEVKHEHANHMTLEQMEAKLQPLCSMIETIKKFMS